MLLVVSIDSISLDTSLSLLIALTDLNLNQAKELLEKTNGDLRIALSNVNRY